MNGVRLASGCRQTSCPVHTGIWPAANYLGQSTCNCTNGLQAHLDNFQDKYSYQVYTMHYTCGLGHLVRTSWQGLVSLRHSSWCLVVYKLSCHCSRRLLTPVDIASCPQPSNLKAQLCPLFEYHERVQQLARYHIVLLDLIVGY